MVQEEYRRQEAVPVEQEEEEVAEKIQEPKSGLQMVIETVERAVCSFDSSFHYPAPHHQNGLDCLTSAKKDVTTSASKLVSAEGDITALTAAATRGKVAVTTMLCALQVSNKYIEDWLCCLQ